MERVVQRQINSGKTSLKLRICQSGLHFFNRNTGMNFLVDEIKPPCNYWSLAPRQVSIALTNICDLDCPHCYAPKNPAVLPLENLRLWLTELDENGCLGVGFGGGEPTLHPNLVDICLYTTKYTNLAVTMTTHGHGFTSQLIKNLENNINFIRISMDGIGKTYEAIRKRSFEKLLEKIVLVKDIIPFGINYIVNSETIGDLETAVELGVCRTFFT